MTAAGEDGNIDIDATVIACDKRAAKRAGACPPQKRGTAIAAVIRCWRYGPNRM
jgi:hypothetical protein